MNRNHAWEEQAKSLINAVILCENPTRESEAYRSFAYLASGSRYFESRGDRKITKGITGLWRPSVRSDVAF